MGIYIKGMEMPIFEHQSWDIRKGTDGKWYMVDTNAETSDGAWHEIVPVPPHGRCIDADEFFKALTMDDRVSILEAMHVQSILSDAPTIIPAEED